MQLGWSPLFAELFLRTRPHNAMQGRELVVRVPPHDRALRLIRGFYDPASKPVVLTKKVVDGIQLQGGTILGTSRGGANMK